jgi:phosphoribosyl 1,2-cyclic phosphodiesterase
VSGEAYRHFGGNTCCLEIHADDHHVIIDGGTGIRPLGLVLQERNVRKIDLFLTHTHWDHVIGLPFFEPIYHPGVHITVWALEGGARSCEELFGELFAAEFFPVKIKGIRNQIEFRTIRSKSPVHIGSMTIDSHPTNHPGQACGFKIQLNHQTIGYISDNEVFPGFHGGLSEVSSQDLKPCEELISFFSGCDILIHEAQYFPEEYRSKTGWGHSSVRNVVALMQRALPREWLVTHHDPCHTDDDLFRLALLAKQLLQENHIPCPVEWVADGHTRAL